MRIVVLPAVVMLLLATLAFATTVDVSLDKNEFAPGERVRIHLEIHPTEEVGGQLAIRKFESNRLVLIRQPYYKPSPSQCRTCTGGGEPLRSDLSKDFYFTPTETGIYQVEANFAGDAGSVRDSEDFTVVVEKTTTTSTTPATSTTTAPTTSSTVSTSTTTTIKQTTTSTFNVAYHKNKAEGGGRLLVYGAVGLLALVVILLIALLLLLRR